MNTVHPYNKLRRPTLAAAEAPPSPVVEAGRLIPAPTAIVSPSSLAVETG